MAIGLVIWAALIAATRRLARSLRRPASRRLWDRTTGTIFIVIGVTLALTHA